MKLPLLLSFSFILLSPAFPQGSLTPPAAPTPTMKTLQQIEPRIDLQNAPASAVTTTDASYHFIITQPGSYYLSGNLAVTKTNGIEISAEGVALDLNGFQISRSSGSGGAGISIDPASHRASIRNGSIKGFASGVQSNGSSILPRACAFRDLAVSGCTSAGIFAGESALIDSCRVHDSSGSYGISADAASTLSNCTIWHSSVAYGIRAGANSTLTNCAVHNNTTINGIFVADGSTLTNCSASQNTSAASVSAGITTTGIGCNIIHCIANNNVSTAGSLTPSSGVGFYLGYSNLIEGCTAEENGGDGIQLTSGTTVRGNIGNSNGYGGGGGAGIHATSSGNRIDGNSVNGNLRGLDVDTGGNLIIRNSAKGNGANYANIVSGNTKGEVVDFSASGGTLDETHGPWANFSF
jgi:hypothetical protein